MARRAVDAGAQMITVHGRTRQQFYKGSARWELVRAVVEAVDVPVVVNGDIVDLATRARGAGAVRRRRGDDRPRRAGPALGCRADRRRAGRRSAGPQAPAGDDARRRSSSSTTRACSTNTASRSACARRASISTGISRPPASRWTSRCATAAARITETPAEVIGADRRHLRRRLQGGGMNEPSAPEPVDRRAAGAAAAGHRLSTRTAWSSSSTTPPRRSSAPR